MAAILTAADPLQVNLTSRHHHEIKQFLKVLRKDQWISLGTALGLDYNNLRSKEAENLLGDLRSGWLNMEGHVKEVSGSPCWASLIKALEDEDHQGIVSKIKESLSTSGSTADAKCPLPRGHVTSEVTVAEKRKLTKRTSPDDEDIGMLSSKRPAITTPAMFQYAAYLKGVCRNSPISPDSKWPPTPSKKYINLATVEYGYKCQDEFIGHTLHGNIKEVLKSRKEISIDEILVPDKEGVAYLKLVLIEGAPGIGKSTLAWELCRKWEQGCMEKYSLTVLLRLREKEVQEIRSIAELFYSCQGEDREILIKEISSSNGKGVLFILDGFDELPKTFQKEGFLVKLIRGIFLPECTVVVTSRPSAKTELLTICRPQINKHIEVLGFIQESVEDYATSIFSAEPEKLQGFKAFISASNNPAINSLMYVPLNAAIIVEIYCDNKSDLLPHTLKQVYTQLCLTILNRYLHTSVPSVRVNEFKDLPSHLYQEFLKLSEAAFGGMRRQEVIFHTLPSDLVHFSFLDAVSSLYGGGSVSYNFLHLTLREFFAAYHISQLCGDARLALLRDCGRDEHWNVVWRFVAGLTEFKFFEGHINSNIFVRESKQDEVEVKLFFVQCLFEANVKMDRSNLFGLKHIYAYINSLQQLDLYALGYCIANLTSEVSWNIKAVSVFTHGLVNGLKTNKVISNTSNVHRLYLGEFRAQSDDAILPYLKHFPLRGITDLTLYHCTFTSSGHFTKFLPSMILLKRLNVTYCTFADSQCADKFLQQLSQTNVTSLDIEGTDLTKSISSLKWLIDRTLEELSIAITIYCMYDDIDQLSSATPLPNAYDASLLDVVCAPSKLKSLRLLHLKNISSLIKLQTNTCLTKLELKYDYEDISKEVAEVIVGILELNKTLECFTMGDFKLPEAVHYLIGINEALVRNNTLKSVVIRIVQYLKYEDVKNESCECAADYIRCKCPNLDFDRRISWEQTILTVPS